MKKVFLLLCLMATTSIAMATDLWEGTHAVDWSKTLTIEAARFAEAKVGQKIVVEFKDATGDVIELHSNGGMLPGTRYMHKIFADQNNMEVFITPGMLACLKNHGRIMDWRFAVLVSPPPRYGMATARTMSMRILSGQVTSGWTSGVPWR